MNRKNNNYINDYFGAGLQKKKLIFLITEYYNLMLTLTLKFEFKILEEKKENFDAQIYERFFRKFDFRRIEKK